MQKIRIILFKGKKLSGDRFPVMIYFYNGSKVRYLSTGVGVHESQWLQNGDLGTVVKHQHASYYNGLINDKFLEVANAVRSGTMDTKQGLKQKIEGISFYIFGEGIAAEFEAQERFSQATCYRAMLKSLQDSQGPLLLSEITIEVAERFKGYLITKERSKNTIRNYIGLIKSLLSKAISRKLIGRDSNQLEDYEIGSAIKGFKTKLSDYDIKRIWAVKLPEDNLCLARAAFLIQYYLQGMRVGDVLQLKKIDIIDNRVKYRARKGGKLKSLPIPTKLLPIINKLLKIKGVYLLPYMNSHEKESKKKIHGRIRDVRGGINECLRVIAGRCGIKKHITTHVSRHSFANKLYRETKDIRLVQDALNHGRVDTTEVYMEDLKDNAMDEAIVKVFG